MLEGMVGDLRVDQGGFDVVVAKEFLDVRDVRTGL